MTILYFMLRPNRQAHPRMAESKFGSKPLLWAILNEMMRKNDRLHLHRDTSDIGISVHDQGSSK
jgi:hypothetical protein